MEERLQKLLASAGIGSRRFCETLITAGRVSVNGKPARDLGAKADAERDEIRVDGRPVSAPPEHVYLVLNKPIGYVTTVSDPHAKHTVMDLVKGVGSRIYPVGRLDADSAGLLLLTNDGAFTQTLTHPSHQVPKTYRVVARGEVPDWAGADLSKGVILEDGMTAPAEVAWVDYDEENNASIIDVTIHEGRNRQVRRMFDAIGFPVLALTRIRIGPVELKGLAPGTWRKLHPSEVAGLLGSADTAPQALPQSPVDNPRDFARPPEESPDRRRDEAKRPTGRTSSGPARRPEVGPRPPAKPAAAQAGKPVVTSGPPNPNRTGGTAPRPIRPASPQAHPPTGPANRAPNRAVAPARPPARPAPPPARPHGETPPVRDRRPSAASREEAAREAARRLAAQLDATPDDDEPASPMKPAERKKDGPRPAGKRPPKRP